MHIFSVFGLPSCRIDSPLVFLVRRFDLLYRKNPFGGEYTVFAGLEECIRFAANFKFTDDDIEYLQTIMPSTCEVSVIFMVFILDSSMISILCVNCVVKLFVFYALYNITEGVGFETSSSRFYLLTFVLVS